MLESSKAARGFAPVHTARLKPATAKAVLGIAMCMSIAVAAEVVGAYLPVVGAPLLALVLGVVISNVLHSVGKARFDAGAVSKWALKCGIVLLGATLNLGDVLRTGASSMLVLLCTVAAGLGVVFVGGARLSVGWRLRCLIGIGTTICGASAIAALAPVVRAKAEEVVYAISVVFLFNMVAVIAFPLIGHLLGLSDQGFGLWAGTAINDTSAVVAAGFGYSQAAGNYATIVKLTRTTLIIPLVLAFGLITEGAARTSGTGEANAPLLRRVIQSVPWFIGLFLVASVLNTIGIVGHLSSGLQNLARLVLVVALAGVGLQGHWHAFVKAGLTPVMLGLATWAAVAIASLVAQTWMGQL